MVNREPGVEDHPAIKNGTMPNRGIHSFGFNARSKMVRASSGCAKGLTVTGQPIRLSRFISFLDHMFSLSLQDSFRLY
jgi:hypothetical protein